MKLPRKLKSTPMLCIYLAVLVGLGLFQAAQVVFNLIGFIGRLVL